MLAILCHTKTVQKLPGYDESDMHYMRRKDAQKQFPQTSLNGILQWFQMPSYIPLHSGVSIEIQNPKRIGLGYQCTVTDKMFSHFGPMKMLKFVLKVFLFSSWCYFRSINPCKWYAICFCWAVTALYVSLFNPAKEQIRLPCPNTQKFLKHSGLYLMFQAFQLFRCLESKAHAAPSCFICYLHISHIWCSALSFLCGTQSIFLKFCVSWSINWTRDDVFFALTILSMLLKYLSIRGCQRENTF